MSQDQRSSLYIGVMSGTSVDAVDVVIISLNDNSQQMIGSYSQAFDAQVREDILSLCQPGHDEIERLGKLNTQLGIFYGESVNKCLSENHIDASEIKAIGLHGQTIRHRPNQSLPFTLQAGDPSIVVHLTGILTVADFRRRDMAAGGQGAPLAPAFHEAFFSHPQETRAIVNAGGLSNISILEPGAAVMGYDCGPGNCLMDGWISRQQGLPFDKGGEWAGQHTPDQSLLDHLLAHPFFKRPPPKSTGREEFNMPWLDSILDDFPDLTAGVVQSTLLDLTARSIADSIAQHPKNIDAIYLCGGGAYNRELIRRLASMTQCNVGSTSLLGIEPQWVECCGFAWLAKNALHTQPTKLQSVTGANEATTLGAIYPP